MTLDVNSCIVHKEAIKRIADRKEPKERFDLIALYAATNNCPVIAAAVFMGQLYGFTDEIRESIRSNMAFYKMTADDLKGYTP